MYYTESHKCDLKSSTLDRVEREGPRPCSIWGMQTLSPYPGDIPVTIPQIRKGIREQSRTSLFHHSLPLQFFFSLFSSSLSRPGWKKTSGGRWLGRQTHWENWHGSITTLCWPTNWDDNLIWPHEWLLYCFQGINIVFKEISAMTNS